MKMCLRETVHNGVIVKGCMYRVLFSPRHRVTVLHVKFSKLFLSRGEGTERRGSHVEHTTICCPQHLSLPVGERWITGDLTPKTRFERRSPSPREVTPPLDCTSFACTSALRSSRRRRDFFSPLEKSSATTTLILKALLFFKAMCWVLMSLYESD